MVENASRFSGSWPIYWSFIYQNFYPSWFAMQSSQSTNLFSSKMLLINSLSKFSASKDLCYTVATSYIEESQCIWELSHSYHLVSYIAVHICSLFNAHVRPICRDFKRGILVWRSRQSKMQGPPDTDKIVIFQHSNYAWMKVSANNGTHNHTIFNV